MNINLHARMLIYIDANLHCQFCSLIYIDANLHCQFCSLIYIDANLYCQFCLLIYIDANLHCQLWRLGSTRITGSMSADKCIELLEQKLAQHGLDLRKDIVGIMTDGASVMK